MLSNTLSLCSPLKVRDPRIPTQQNHRQNIFFDWINILILRNTNWTNSMLYSEGEVDFYGYSMVGKQMHLIMQLISFLSLMTAGSAHALYFGVSFLYTSSTIDFSSMWDLKFSWLWLWTLLCSGMWDYTIRHIVTSVLEATTATIFTLLHWIWKQRIPWQHWKACSWLRSEISQKTILLTLAFICQIVS
jgi:hypothetical protein